MPFFLEDLNKLKCQNPECDHSNHSRDVYFVQKCHPGAQTTVFFSADDGVLVLTCPVCGSIVASFNIASRKEPEE